jgi:hypothetical protein
MPALWRDLTGMDPSWMPRVIGILIEDHPDVWRQAWTAAVDRNAAEQAAPAEGPAVVCDPIESLGRQLSRGGYARTRRARP